MFWETSDRKPLLSRLSTARQRLTRLFLGHNHQQPTRCLHISFDIPSTFRTKIQLTFLTDIIMFRRTHTHESTHTLPKKDPDPKHKKQTTIIDCCYDKPPPLRAGCRATCKATLKRVQIAGGGGLLSPITLSAFWRDLAFQTTPPVAKHKYKDNNNTSATDVRNHQVTN